LSRLYNATTFELKMSFNVSDLSMCFVYNIRLAGRKFLLPLSVITKVIIVIKVINVLKGI